MFDTWKSLFRSAEASDGYAGQEQDGAASGPPETRLTRMLADLKGEHLPEGAWRTVWQTPAAETVTAEPTEAEPLQAETPEAEAPQAHDTPEVIATAPSYELPKAEDRMPETLHMAAPSGEELTAAQRLVAQQREAAEALLLEVRALENRLQHEAQAAHAAAECAAANEKAEGAAALEYEASERARAAADRAAAIASDRQTAQAQAASARADAEAARARVAELEQRLSAQEARAQECAQSESAAQHEASEAASRLVACQAAREGAQAEAEAAKERAAALRAALPGAAAGLAGTTDVQSLAVRISEQAAGLERIRTSAALSLAG